jgi:hypothetical protein
MAGGTGVSASIVGLVFQPFVGGCRDALRPRSFSLDHTVAPRDSLRSFSFSLFWAGSPWCPSRPDATPGGETRHR